ncbi:MAG: Lpg1974 family pore-forming outer membrane protein [Simkaniaceae bacterium]
MISIEKLEEKIENLENRLDGITSQNDQNDTNAITLTSARPEVEGKKWFATFDLLYWHPRVGGTTYAYTNWRPSIDLPIKGRTRKIKFKWDVGLRAGLGYNFCHDKWDIFLNYTYFDSNSTHNCQAGKNSVLIPMKGSIITQSDVFNAKSSFTVGYDSIDLELGRHFFVSGKLSLRPFISVKTSWVELDQRTRYFGGAELGLDTVTEKGRSHFWGLGPRLGLNSMWILEKGFHLIGNVSGAMLYGFHDVDLKEHRSRGNDSIKLHDSEHRFSPTVQLFLGGGYGTYINEKEHYLSLQLGYEVEYYWRQNQMLRVYQYHAFRYENLSEDLSFNGLTFKIRLDF